MTPPPLPPEVNARIVRPHRARTIVILGGLGFVFAPFGFFAMIMGKRDLRDMEAGTMDRSGEALTKVRRMLAFVSSIVWICCVFNLVYKGSVHRQSFQPSIWCGV